MGSDMATSILAEERKGGRGRKNTSDADPGVLGGNVANALRHSHGASTVYLLLPKQYKRQQHVIEHSCASRGNIAFGENARQ